MFPFFIWFMVNGGVGGHENEYIVQRRFEVES